jgi:hypothetical protein
MRLLNLCMIISINTHASQTKQPHNVSSNTTWIKVESQAGSDCGYHAIYNGIAQYMHLTSNQSLGSLPKKLLNQWRTHIQDYRARAGRNSAQAQKGGWLDDGEVEDLVNDFCSDQPEFKNNITVIPNVIAFNPENQDLTSVILALQKNHTAHIFIVGNMVQNKPNQQGHWIAVVVQRANNKYHYYALDSLNNNPQHFVNGLAQILTTDINILHLANNQLLSDAESQLNARNNTAQALLHINEFMILAQDAGAFNSPAFHIISRRIASLLRKIAKDKHYKNEALVLLQTLNEPLEEPAQAAQGGIEKKIKEKPTQSSSTATAAAPAQASKPTASAAPQKPLPAGKKKRKIVKKPDLTASAAAPKT